MKERKQSANWNIAGTLWLTAGFVVPFIIEFLGFLILTLLFGENQIALGIGLLILYPLSIWLGTIYASRYINKSYVVTDKLEIAKLATIYLVVTGVGYRIFQYFNEGVIIYETVGFIIGVVIFYFSSIKYLQITSNTEQQQNQQPTMTEGGPVS